MVVKKTCKDKCPLKHLYDIGWAV